MNMLNINVNEHTEKKNGLTYLSWAWAWAEVLKHDPGALWVVHTYGPQGCESPCMWIGKTAMVHVSVTIKGLRRECMLPVMDHRNKAIQEPDAFQVNTAIMRCMTKAISMHGLGLYIYAGEDLPEQAAETEEQKVELEWWEKRKDDLNGVALDMLNLDIDGRQSAAINYWYNSSNWSADNATANKERKYVWGLLRENSKLRSAIKANAPAVTA